MTSDHTLSIIVGNDYRLVVEMVRLGFAQQLQEAPRNPAINAYADHVLGHYPILYQNILLERMDMNSTQAVLALQTGAYLDDELVVWGSRSKVCSAWILSVFSFIRASYRPSKRSLVRALAKCSRKWVTRWATVWAKGAAWPGPRPKRSATSSCNAVVSVGRVPYWR